MDTQTYHKIKKQYLLTWNLSFLVVGCLYLYFITTYQIELVLLYVGFLVILSGIYELLTYKKPFYLFPWTRQLVEFAREKLGKEWRKQRLGGGLLSIGLGLFFVWNSRSVFDGLEPARETTGTFVVTLIMFIILIIILNATQLHSLRQIEKKSTEELQGSFLRRSLVGIVIGLVIGWVMFIGIIIFVMYLSTGG